MRSGFQDLVASYLDLRWQLDPVAATTAGLTEHDHRLGCFTVDDVRQHVAAFRSLAGALEEIDVDGLEDEIDRTALLDDVRVTIHRFTAERAHRINPSFWLEHALEGLYHLLARRDRPLEHRARAAAQRLAAVPPFLTAARETLEECPRVFIETARGVAGGAGALIGEVAGQLRPREDGGFDRTVQEALGAVDGFATFLEKELTDSADGGYAIGEDAFDFRLHHEHALRAVAPELWRYGLRLADEVEAELTAMAAEIAPGTRWPDLVDRLRGTHPPAEQLVGAYAAEMERARQFVLEHDLVPIPEGPLDVVETPAFLKPLIPYAAYQAPGPFARDRTGWFYVTPPGSQYDAVTRERMLRDHCVHELASTALHEGYPGHHLQFLMAQQQERTVRKLIGTPLTIEGWALYCEEMMGEEGFYRGVEERFFQRVHLLWRALRIVLDVGLHTRGMSFDEAVDVLVHRVHLDRRNAEAEVRRYCAYPAYQLCYAVGRRELKALRQAYRRAQGAAFSLRGFHEAALQYGGLPVSLMRWGMGLDE
ncbi:MAG: DUF885 domain-containing protein [Gemmatimonadetes bacterium]|nr:DUF885 domain-containing protein [Gemmatimonadota bacterium]MBI2404235.1 DUF885 domain-containing protein [Gemmatimonadota bacterium]